ncbi:hypothetical protein ACHWQZ_G016965 [Mnemiopsis leidyi]
MSDAEWSNRSGFQSKRRKRKKSSKEGGSCSELGVVTPQLKNKMMELIQAIMRKDIHMIFAEPVSDLIAPGYSTIISSPMDLSTMQAKVQRGEYSTLKDVKDDADLMCKNCMVYNSDDTIFYKEAVKLQNFINTLFGEKKNKAALSHEVREGIRKKNEIQEEWMAEEITRSVKKAAADAKEAYDRLASGTRVGYLSKDEDSKSVVLNILNPQPGEPTEKLVDLSCFEPHENTTTSLLNNFREKKRLPNKPPQYLHYGPFGSFMPSYDSVFSSLDDADQQLLYSCYGDEIGLAYCRSVQEFAKGCHDSLRQPVDNIINSLTAGGHMRANKLLAQKYAKIIREKRLMRARRLGTSMKSASQSATSASGESSAAETEPGDSGTVQEDKKNGQSTTEMEDEYKEEESLLKLLESDDIPDILNDPDLQVKLETACEDTELQEKLEKTGGLLAELHQEQTARLSKPPVSSTPAVWEMGTTETSLASQVRDNLTDMISGHVPPRNVIGEGVARQAISSDLVDKVTIM